MKNILLCLFGLLLGSSLFAQSADAKKPFHDFDFWLGEWNVYKYGTDTLVGQSKIEPIIDSLGIRETYHAAGSKYHGTSLNKYNPLLKTWEQFWVDNGGLSLHIKGGFEGNKMVMEGVSYYPKGKVHERISWHNLSDGTVRQVWEQSRDEGKTWKKVFDGLYKPKGL